MGMLHIDPPCGPVRVIGPDSGEKNKGIVRCLGLPYAIADRFAAPIGMPPWLDRLDCTAFGTPAPQPPSELDDFLRVEGAPPIAEACQNLNIFAPMPLEGNRPVMVWVHGGSFVFGSSLQPVYEASELARRTGAVIVTVNYRLGVFGFLRLKEATGGAINNSGNEGLLDQIEALKWVQNNIQAFGGNPNNVTIFGESAGAMSIACLLAMPATKGLFIKAILQSGGADSVHTLERSEKFALGYIKAFGSDDPDAMKNTPMEAWLTAQKKYDVTPELGWTKSIMPLRPTIDGEHLPCLPVEAIRQGVAKDVQLMSGTTRDEYRLFALADPKLLAISIEGVKNRCINNLGEDKGRELFDLYHSDQVPPVEVLSQIYTDHVFRMPVERMLAAQAEHRDDCYQYYFTFESPAYGGALGACHALELGYVFGTHNGGEGLIAFYGEGEEAEALSNCMSAAWGDFAHSGTIEGWPRYDKALGPVMTLGRNQEVTIMPGAKRLSFWNDVPDDAFSLL